MLMALSKIIGGSSTIKKISLKLYFRFSVSEESIPSFRRYPAPRPNNIKKY
jgi:hypothetical protein